MALPNSGQRSDVALSTASFFVLRTPLLAWDVFERWGAAERAATGTSGGLREIVARPEVREALFLASPSLDEHVERWLKDASCNGAQKIERSLSRYVARMAGRATPLGLLAGQSLGTFGESTQLELGALKTYRRCLRLGATYLTNLAEQLCRSAPLRAELRYRVNDSVHRFGQKIRYVELRGGVSGYSVVSVDVTEYLLATLDRARSGATLHELAQPLLGAGVELDEALEFVVELIDSRMLVADLAVPVTSVDPVDVFLTALESLSSATGVAKRARAAVEKLAELEVLPLGIPSELYRALAASLSAEDNRSAITRTFSVDLWKPGSIALGRDVQSEILRSVELLSAIGERPRRGPLQQFRDAFFARYDKRAIPLLEAVDSEMGIGFESAFTAFLEVGLSTLRTPRAERQDWAAKHGYLLRQLGRTDRALEIELTDADLRELSSVDPPALVGSFAAIASLAAASSEALRRGDFQVRVHSCVGPSGASLLGRFCRTSPELAEYVQGVLADEAALRPDAVFAEIAYLPGGERGDLVLRPVLRAHEIPYLGRSGAVSEQQISVHDLWLSVVGERVLLHSKRLGQEVIVRLTSPYNALNPNDPPVFRFLAALQAQQDVHFMWSWGALEDAEFLPRLRVGRIVISLARWRIQANQLAAITRAAEGGRHAAFRSLALELGLPRWFVSGETDQRLCVDLENGALVDAFLHGVKNRAYITVTELWPSPDQLCVAGPEGRFIHELIVPILAQPKSNRVRSESRSPIATSPGARTFHPGSEWLYAKLYTGHATADDILLDVIQPIAAGAMACQSVESWFFIRYGDPEHHLRVRFHGDPKRLYEDVLPRLERAASALLDNRLIWKMQIDTYERESERYGGERGTSLSERLFHVDSEAVLEIMGALRGGVSANKRLAITLKGIDSLFDDLGLSLQEKLAITELLSEASRKELQIEPALVHELGDKFRRAKAELEPVFNAADIALGDDAVGPALRAIGQRSARIVPIADQLRAGIASGLITASLSNLAASYAHMHAIRALRSSVRLHELIIHDFLRRLYKSKLARAERT
jgi:thiopeptide-type bacteriocin biosynthesis protein